MRPVDLIAAASSIRGPTILSSFLSLHRPEMVLLAAPSERMIVQENCICLACGFILNEQWPFDASELLSDGHCLSCGSICVRG